MDLIIAGSRSITDREVVEDAFEASGFSWGEVDVVISGGADGVDSFGEELAGEYGVPVDVFPVDEYVDEAPNEYVAPLVRNSAMAEEGDALLAVQEDESSGTADMIQKALDAELDVYVEKVNTRTLDEFF